MIQVLGLRDYTSNGSTRKRETFFQRGWRFERIQDVFNPEKISTMLAGIPEAEHFNLYFTVADCFEEAGRKLKEQWAIPFDIDGLHLEEGKEHAAAERAARIALTAIDVQYNDAAVLFTGNGVQFFVMLESPIVDEEFFDSNREGYGLLAKRIQLALVEAGVQGTVDTSVFSKGRLMRLPGTLNRKPNKPERRSYILNEGGTPIHFDIVDRSGVATREVAGTLTDVVLKNYPKPDTKAVCEGCKFLTWCKDSAAEVSEPQWYAMTSITARLDDGAALTHQYSEGHPGYNHYETETKIDQALSTAGPRTCKDIDSRWDGCKDCDYYGKVASPIMIKGKEYIASADFGYRERKQVESGGTVRVVPGKPAYQDLIKQFYLDTPYRVLLDTDQAIRFNGKFWEVVNDRALIMWMTERVVPEPTSNEMREFIAQFKARHPIKRDDMLKSREGLMNFSNCVLDVRSRKVMPHSEDFGFFEARPFAYDKHATCPTWDKFMVDVMGGDLELMQALEEFAGYCISGDTPWLQKALMIVGDGANGKSVFMETLGDLVGRDAHSSVPLQELSKDVMRYQLVNKLFNYSEETSVNSMRDSSMFKTLVSGGAMTVKQLYAQPAIVPNMAKIIISANDMPASNDRSEGTTRRLAIIHFKQKFVPGDGKHDYYIKDKLSKELPGICNKLLNAYVALRERGILIGSAKIQEAVKEYQDTNDTVRMFINECMDMVPDNEIKVGEVYEEYVRMCEMGKLYCHNKITFGKQLTKLTGINSELVSRNGEKYRTYKGIKLNKGY